MNEFTPDKAENTADNQEHNHNKIQDSIENRNWKQLTDEELKQAIQHLEDKAIEQRQNRDLGYVKTKDKIIGANKELEKRGSN